MVERAFTLIYHIVNEISSFVRIMRVKFFDRDYFDIFIVHVTIRFTFVTPLLYPGVFDNAMRIFMSKMTVVFKIVFISHP